MTIPLDGHPHIIIKDAMREAGILRHGAEPDSEVLVNNMRKIRDILYFWQTQGLKLWTWQDEEVTLVAGTDSYTLAPRPQKLEQAYWKSGGASPYTRPIDVEPWDTFLRRQSPEQAGTVTMVFADKRHDRFNVKVWSVPNAAEAEGTLHLLLRGEIEKPYQLDERIVFPPEWRIALVWALADELASGQPQATMDRCAQRASFYRAKLEESDNEDTSVRFVPDLQGYTNRSFR